MKVELLHCTPLDILIKAIRKCYDSGDKSDSEKIQNGDFIKHFKLGAKDKALILRIIEHGHTSTLEHYCIPYSIECNNDYELTLYKYSLLDLLSITKGIEYEVGHLSIFININIRNIIEGFNNDNLIINIVKGELSQSCPELYEILISVMK